MKGLEKLKSDQIKITLAEESVDKSPLGYCISFFEGAKGETKSLHVLESARKKGIGRGLMRIHLQWLRENGCKDIVVEVLLDNEQAVDFYRDLGFKNHTLEMRLV